MLHNGLVLKYRNESLVVCSEYGEQISFEATTSDSLIFYVEGNGSVIVGEKEYNVSNSCLLLLPKSTRISCAVRNDKLNGKLVTIILTEDIVWDYKCHFERELRTVNALLTKFHRIDKEYIAQFFVALIIYSQRRLLITEEILRHRIFEILHAIESLIWEEKVLTKETVVRQSNIRTIANHISVDLSCRKPIPEIAKDYGVSASTLKRWFKKGLDVSLNQWLIMRRLEKVRFLVRRGKSIKEASFECGFCSSSYMIKMYRRRYGCTPVEDLNQTKFNTN